jgi:PAS domain S-box-containing protein
VSNDIEHDESMSQVASFLLSSGFKAAAALPLVRDGKAVGVYCLYSGSVDFFDRPEMELLDELARDISFALLTCDREVERQRALAELHRKEEHFRMLIEGSSDLIAIIDGGGRIRYHSPTVKPIMGYEVEEILGHSFDEYMHPDDIDNARDGLRRLLQGKSGNSAEYRMRHKDGRWRLIHAISRVLPNAEGDLRIVINSRDITERHELEQQLAQSQKMQAMGTLAGGIAHDFNNILSAILGNAEMARLDLEATHPALASVSEIQRAGQRARELVQRILSFSRPHELDMRVTELGAVAEEAVRLLRATIPAGIELRLTLQQDLPAVRADAPQIHQVILNLVTNAWHAIDGRTGLIEVKLAGCRVDSALRVTHPELEPGLYVRLSISDSGRGISPENLPRIFDPFFTTKELGQGTGLGLSIVHGIVRSHQGAIIVETNPTHGTTFHVYFPVAKPDASLVERKGSNGAEAVGRGEHILFIDDEEPLVVLAKKYLERIGFRVSGFTSPADALHEYRKRPNEFDLVITDYNMPKLSGLEVARQIVSLRPGAKVALASGYLRPEDVEAARNIGIAEILLKPNFVEEFAPMIRRILDKLDERAARESKQPINNVLDTPRTQME